MSDIKKPPRVLIEDWLPAAAIGVECMRERGSASALAPTTYLHIWWARRPLCASRAAVLGSILPADFPHDEFERLLGFWGSSKQIIEAQRIVDIARIRGGLRIQNPHGERAFKKKIELNKIEKAHNAAKKIWNSEVIIIDPMAGGGSIPLESCRLGFETIANEYNPVACSILEATIDYPSKYGEKLASKTRIWGEELRRRFNSRMKQFYPDVIYNGKKTPAFTYIFTRTIPCPDTEGNPHTPLIPDWYLLKPKGGSERVWVEPIIDNLNGTWSTRIIDNRIERPKNVAPSATYSNGKGISLFNKATQISADYIKAKAQAGEMRSYLYAIAIKTHKGTEFMSPSQSDYEALASAELELARLRPDWDKRNIIPTEKFPTSSTDPRPLLYGMPYWIDMYTPRQLLAIGSLVDELDGLHQEIIDKEGKEFGNAIIHILAFSLDKFLNHNCNLTRYENTRSVVKGKMDRHDFAFKPTFAELAPCNSGSGFGWAIANVTEAYEEISKFVDGKSRKPAIISQGSATNLPHVQDKSITAVVVDPPYADNVQYSELADFFYVWLKRTIGYQHPEWFSTYLCDHSEEAVVNASRFKETGLSPIEAKKNAKEAKQKANDFYQNMMTDAFKESHRILRDDGVLTVMFTHKKQEAWESLFTALIRAGFMITATWPVKTESEHSLHQAKKNAAQSTVILVARKRPADADITWFDSALKTEIRAAAQRSAERLQKEGLNPVDQLVGSFGPAMEVFSRHSEVRTETGEPVTVDRALDEASSEVTEFRIRQLSKRGLEGVEAEGKFYLLCWDVLQAAEFRFNEAKLLGHAVGMDVDTLVAAGLVSKKSDNIKLLSAEERRRARKLDLEEAGDILFGSVPIGKKKGVKKTDTLKVHPNDPHFRTALDACHALALRYIEAGGGNPGIGSARQLATQQNWGAGSPVARLMEALVKAAPPALWFEKGKTSAAAEYPEFRAWHTLLEILFGIVPPEWKEISQADLGTFGLAGSDESDTDDNDDSDEEVEEE